MGLQHFAAMIATERSVPSWTTTGIQNGGHFWSFEKTRQHPFRNIRGATHHRAVEIVPQVLPLHHVGVFAVIGTVALEILKVIEDFVVPNIMFSRRSAAASWLNVVVIRQAPFRGGFSGLSTGFIEASARSRAGIRPGTGSA